MSPRTSHEELYGSANGQREHDAFEERLQDNRMTPVPEQAAFRIDFPVWLRTWSERDRRIIEDMAQDHRTFDLSRKYGCSPGRISQKREQSTKTGIGSMGSRSLHKEGQREEAWEQSRS